MIEIGKIVIDFHSLLFIMKTSKFWRSSIQKEFINNQITFESLCKIHNNTVKKLDRETTTIHSLKDELEQEKKITIDKENFRNLFTATERRIVAKYLLLCEKITTREINERTGIRFETLSQIAKNETQQKEMFFEGEENNEKEEQYHDEIMFDENAMKKMIMKKMKKKMKMKMIVKMEITIFQKNFFMEIRLGMIM